MDLNHNNVPALEVVGGVTLRGLIRGVLRGHDSRNDSQEETRPVLVLARVWLCSNDSVTRGKESERFGLIRGMIRVVADSGEYRVVVAAVVVVSGSR